MAYNMQVAFSTTVVGMAVAAIGAVTLQGNKDIMRVRLTILILFFKNLMRNETESYIDRKKEDHDNPSSEC